MDACTHRQYDEAQNKLEEAIAMLEGIYRDENTAFENRPILWQRTKAGQAELVRLLVMENLIEELQEDVGTISALEPGSCELTLLPHRAVPTTISLKF